MEDEKPKPARKPRTRKAAPQPWWHGLSDATADELRRRGYSSRDDALLCVNRRIRFAGKSRQKRLRPYDPLYQEHPWRNDGMPLRISLDVLNEVRAWLGAEPISP